MGVTKNYNAFPSFTKDGRNYILNRSGRFPLDETEVFTSLANLKEYLKGDIVYPGQIVSVADDRTDNKSTQDRTEQGLYYINNTASNNDTYEAQKIALLSDVGGDANVDTIVKLLNALYGDTDNGTIWDEATVSGGGYSPDTAVITLSDVITRQESSDEYLYVVENGDAITQ